MKEPTNHSDILLYDRFVRASIDYFSSEESCAEKMDKLDELSRLCKEAKRRGMLNPPVDRKEV